VTFRYIGSKARISQIIGRYIGKKSSEAGRFIDAFCGTGAIGVEAADLGWPLVLNDSLACAATMSAARLVSSEQATFKVLGGYGKVVGVLNTLEPLSGYVRETYSPESLKYVGIERRYFTEHNAGKIDAIREKIRLWADEGKINRFEEQLLIADLLSATNRIANIAGTYGCFLSQWTAQALGQLEMRMRTLRPRTANVEVFVGDASNIKIQSEDTVYLDPPYTKRQYASYYHILETITLGDRPTVEGVSGLRPWKDLASDFCYKVRALDAISTLISSIAACRIFLSYSSEGHVRIDSLREVLAVYGSVSTFVMKEVGRYRPNKVASETAGSVKEFLIVVDRTSDKNVNSAMEDMSLSIQVPQQLGLFG